MNPAISQAACELQIEALRDGRKGSDLFMWTITAPVALDVTEWARRFGKFISMASDIDGLAMRGVRVWEWHPGEFGDGESSHGVHAHLIVVGWYPVNLVRSIARRFGLGRINVTHRLRGASYLYAVKYVSKARRDRVPALQGRRIWAAFGLSGQKRRVKAASRGNPLPHQVRCKDIVVDSLLTRACKVVKDRAGLKGMPMLFAAQGVAWYALAYDDPQCGSVAYEGWRSACGGRWLTGMQLSSDAWRDTAGVNRRSRLTRRVAA